VSSDPVTPPGDENGGESGDYRARSGEDPTVWGEHESGSRIRFRGPSVRTAGEGGLMHAARLRFGVNDDERSARQHAPADVAPELHWEGDDE
jgi:hypothetical protein